MSGYHKLVRINDRDYSLATTKSGRNFTTTLCTICSSCNELATYTMSLRYPVQKNTLDCCDCFPRRYWIHLLVGAAISLNSDELDHITEDGNHETAEE